MKKVLLFCFVCLFLQSAALFADASGVASFNRVDVAVNDYGNVTCVQDSRDPSQWYYVPNEARLALNRNGEPVFMLVSWQKNKKKGIENGGAVLQAAFNLSLPLKGKDGKEVLQTLQKGIASGSNNLKPKKIKLAPLNMKNAKVVVYSPGGEQIANSIKSPDIGSTFANESIPIQMNLTELGTAVVEDLVKGKSGIGVQFVFDYDALTPECSVKITADYDKIYKHLSIHSNTNAGGGWSWWFDASANVDVQKVFDEFKDNNLIEVKVIGGKELSGEQLALIQKPVLTKIFNDFLNVEAPKKVDPTKVEKAQKSQDWHVFAVNSNFALKDKKEIKTGTFTFDYSIRSNETCQSIVAGYLNPSQYYKDCYSKKIKDEKELAKKVEEKLREVIVTVDPTYWKSAIYGLPSISKKTGISEVTLALNILYKGKQPKGVEQLAAKWTPEDGWVDFEDEPISCLMFPLKYFYDNYENKSEDFAKDITYDKTFNITYMEGRNTRVKKSTVNIPAFIGDIPVSTPMVEFEYVEVNANEGDITFRGTEYESGEFEGIKSDLTSIEATFETPDKKTFGAKLNQNNLSACFWLDRVKNKAGEYETPKLKGTYKFYTSKKFLNIADKDQKHDAKAFIVNTDNALLMGSTINLYDWDYLPNTKPEKFK